MDFLKDIDNTWTLFLDRDGVINFEKKDDYIRNLDEFTLYEGVLEAFKLFANKFHKIIIVTNQRGIGKGLMTHDDLHTIHHHLQKEVTSKGSNIDSFYYAPDLETDAINRKPNTGMAMQAKADHPDIDFAKSIMIGNNISDMLFGKTLGMKTVFLQTTNPQQDVHEAIDEFSPTLLDFAKKII